MVFSGLTVCIGVLSLVVIGVPFLRSVGYAEFLVPLISVLVSVTLLPVVLATVGPRLDWPRQRTDLHASRFCSGRQSSPPTAGRGIGEPARRRRRMDRRKRVQLEPHPQTPACEDRSAVAA